MYINNKILMAKNDSSELYLLPRMANRHGLITGASGSGKTITLKVMAEGFSSASVPVLLVDVKGDLAGTCKMGVANENIYNRIEKLKLEGFKHQAFPVNFFDVFKKNGHPIRTTIADIGPRLLSRMLNLSDAQEGNLAIAFEIAKDSNMKLNDLNDLNDLLTFVSENKDRFNSEYGNITTQSIGSIKRNLLALKQDGGDNFFGKPSLDLFDLMQYDQYGRGFINILDAQELFKKPTLYAVFLIWLLNNLYDNMPEVGDLDKPKLVLCLDEAHLIFSEMSSHLIKQITQIVKLIRSKGIGVYFISQSPSDVPDEILAQLGNKVQHVLRSYTPSDEKAIKAASNAFRANPNFKTEDAIRNLATGEAVVSFLNEKGEPSVCEVASILPPQSLMGTISDSDREAVIRQSRIYMKYENEVNEISASEMVDSAREQIENEKLEAIRLKEEAKEQEKTAKLKAKEEEKRKQALDKQSNKIVKQVGNKFVNKATTKVVNSIWKSIFK